MAEQTRVMGVVNVTPDSFSDGGLYLDPEAAIAHATELAAEGADILDVTGESGPGVPVSIDTSKASVAGAALDAGAVIVNDVTALRADPELASLCADRNCEVVLMHMLGTPRTMQDDPRYDDVVDDVKSFLVARISAAMEAGIDERRIWVDPGIGFGKTVAHNLELLRRLDEIVAIGRPVVIGTSRKSFLGKLAGGRGEDERLPGTIATNVMALERGACVFRVHDVRPVADALAIAAATVGP